MPEVLIGRHKRLSFMKTSEGTYQRMTKFTSLSESKSPIEYSRQYVDMASESTDVVGYSSSVGFSFDRHSENEVHKQIANIFDNELLGDEARVEILTVDLYDEADNKYAARKRVYSVIPDAIGDGTDALIYSGTFRAVSEITTGKATTSDAWKTASFEEDE